MVTEDTFRARLGAGPDEVYLDNLLAPEFEVLREHFFGPQLLLNRAHVLMLREVGVLTADEAGRILAVFDELEEEGVPDSVTGADYEGVHFYVESVLIDELGEYLGGILQTGRSRTDVYDAVCRIIARRRVLEVIAALSVLRAALLDRAAETTDVVTTGYTHSRPAQPMTLSHYLLAVDHALERDFERLSAAFENANQNPLGAAVLGGTGFDVDRERLSELCGFSSLCYNTYDATATMDFAPEATGGVSVLMCTVSRLARDLIDWSTFEYDYLEISDSFASVSSMMPQKKNPYSLEKLRTAASSTIGASTTTLAHLKGAPYGDVSEVAKYVLVPLLEQTDEVVRMLNLMAGVVDTMTVNADTMLENAEQNFCTMTEVADTLVRQEDLSFRQAHEIVGTMVQTVVDDGRRADEITLSDLQAAARAVDGAELSISRADLQAALDPVVNVERRDLPGGTAPECNEADLARQRERLDEQFEWVEQARARLNDAEAERRARSEEYTGR
jgi:argininosuccinate lyase